MITIYLGGWPGLDSDPARIDGKRDRTPAKMFVIAFLALLKTP